MTRNSNISNALALWLFTSLTPIKNAFVGNCKAGFQRSPAP